MFYFVPPRNDAAHGGELLIDLFYICQILFHINKKQLIIAAHTNGCCYDRRYFALKIVQLNTQYIASVAATAAFILIATLFRAYKTFLNFIESDED